MSQSSNPEERHLPDESAARLPQGIRELADRLDYPVNSKAHLTEQLGGPDAHLSLRGKTEVRTERWVRFLPAQLFPVVSGENFIEKLDELYASTPKPPMSADEIIGLVTNFVQENSATIDQLFQMFRGIARQSLR